MVLKSTPIKYLVAPLPMSILKKALFVPLVLDFTLTLAVLSKFRENHLGDLCEGHEFLVILPSSLNSSIKSQLIHGLVFWTYQ